MTNKIYKSPCKALGLMSGTSLDGVDAALLETDGHGYIRPLAFLSLPYDTATRDKIRAALGLRDRADPRVKAAAEALTRRHIEIVKKLGQDSGISADIIGFHGQTILHDPAHHLTIQIGDAALLAKETGIDVVHDFRTADVKAGGQGAPFLPLYHRARAANLPKPLAVLNLGGVGNVTWIGKHEDDILAFDTGPGNALIDDFMLDRTGKNFDENGAAAARGAASSAIVESFMAHPYFAKPAPKSLDRDMWDIASVENLSTEDGAATLSAFTVVAVTEGARRLPGKPLEWLVTGGGRHNLYLMQALQKTLGAPVNPVEKHGWNGDALEAEGFAWLAVRSLLGLPLSVPGTTGVPKPATGGTLYKAS